MANDMQFIDWLDIYQNHPPRSLPVLGTEHRVSTSLETGELLSQVVTGYKHKGSWDTSLLLRSNGDTISCKGNPSSFDRTDNLFGHRDMLPALEVYNRQLVAHGLPIIDETIGGISNPGLSIKFQSYRKNLIVPKSDKFVGWFQVNNGQRSQYTDTWLTDNQPKLTRVDITENLATDDAMAFIRHMSMYIHHGKCGYLYPNGQTVDWGGSRRVYTKYYNKAWDIGQKIKKLEKSLNSKHRDLIQEHIDYLKPLQKWCIDNGIVRRETSFKSTEIIDRKVQHIHNWSNEYMTNIIRPYQFHKKMRIEETSFENISDILLASGGITSRVARQAHLVHTAWVQGDDVKALCGSQRSYYRYRNLLLNVGVDIFNPCDISKLTLRVNKSEWAEIDPPSWYRMPLRVAA